MSVCPSVCVCPNENFLMVANIKKYCHIYKKIEMAILFLIFFGSDMSKMDQTWSNACKTRAIFLVLNKTEKSFIPTGCTKYDKMYNVTFNIYPITPLQIFTALFPPTLANTFTLFSGNENRVNAKVIRRLKDKKTAMDRAREMLRNR